jgi:hypothetical protein
MATCSPDAYALPGSASLSLSRCWLCGGPVRGAAAYLICGPIGGVLIQKESELREFMNYEKNTENGTPRRFSAKD